MNKTEFWKTFVLGDELHISGRFMYNGLCSFHEMDTLHYEDEIFEALYNLSVGLERLFKVAVILIEHDEMTDIQKFERGLITHNHQSLFDRIKSKHALKVGPSHNDFLQLLSKFYKTHRYGRYIVNRTLDSGGEKRALHEFISKHLGVEIKDSPPFQVAQNSQRIRRFIGDTVGTLATQVFQIIRTEANRIGIYTFELRSDSKAEKLFVREKFTFDDEEILNRELIIYFINSSHATGHVRLAKEIEPLPFEPGLEDQYIRCMGSYERKLELLDELEALYEDMESPLQRKKLVNVLGDPLVSLDEGTQEEGDD